MVSSSDIRSIAKKKFMSEHVSPDFLIHIHISHKIKFRNHKKDGVIYYPSPYKIVVLSFINLNF